MVHTTREATSELLASDTGSEPFVFGPNQTKWLEMLETTKRKQARGTLRTQDDHYCCLGIALLALGKKPSHIGGSCLPSEAALALGLYDDVGSPRIGAAETYACSALNDVGMFSFKEIAARLRANPRVYFWEPR